MADLITVARPYAKAIFEQASGENQISQWMDFLNCGALITENPIVLGLIKDPRIKADEMVSFYETVSAKFLFPEAKNLLRLLEENSRLEALPDIAKLYAEHVADYNKTIDVEVKSFAPLSEEQKQKLTQTLKQRLKRDVTLNIEIDTKLLGGFTVRAGDYVIDGSIRGQLTKLKKELIA